MKPWLSLMGIYKYDHSIFDQLQLPAELDKDTFLANLLTETAELEVLYPDTEILKQMIGYWSARRLHSWERIAEVLYEDYDPFINIKRDEVRTIESSGDNTNQVSAWNKDDFTNRDHSTGSSFVKETFHVEGDSAITDAQDVARKEIEVRTKYDLYTYIINDFKNRFCILVY